MKEYLPLGTVVILNEGKKKLLIYGRKQTDIKTNIEYDYVSCLYPEGNINQDYMFLFNEEDIKEVIFRGYSNSEDEEFLDKLNEI